MSVWSRTTDHDNDGNDDDMFPMLWQARESLMMFRLSWRDKWAQVTLRDIWHHSLLLSLSLSPLPYNAQWARRRILVIFGFYHPGTRHLLYTRLAGNFTGVHYGCSGWVVAINEQVTTYGTTDHSLPAPLPVSGLREREPISGRSVPRGPGTSGSLWLVQTDHVTWILASDWMMMIGAGGCHSPPMIMMLLLMLIGVRNTLWVHHYSLSILSLMFNVACGVVKICKTQIIASFFQGSHVFPW